MLSANIQRRRFWHQGKSPGTHFLLPFYVLVNHHGARMVTTDFECTTVITKWQLEGSFGGSHTAARNITKTLLDSNLATYNQFLNVHIVCTRNYIHRNQPVPMSQAWRCYHSIIYSIRTLGTYSVLRRITWEIQVFHIVE